MITSTLKTTSDFMDALTSAGVGYMELGPDNIAALLASDDPRALLTQWINEQSKRMLYRNAWAIVEDESKDAETRACISAQLNSEVTDLEELRELVQKVLEGERLSLGKSNGKVNGVDHDAIDDRIVNLTKQALNGSTEKNRHLALVQLLRLISTAEGDDGLEMIGLASDAAIKYAHGINQIVGALLTNQPLPPLSEFDDAPVIPIKSWPDRSGNGNDLNAPFLSHHSADVITDPPEHEPGDSATMSDDAISALTGRLQKSVDNSLREMADAIRGGKCPGEAFQEVMSAFIESGRDIPQHEYDGMTHTEWWADKERRAEAIMADESGRYADSTKAAIKLVYTEMRTPGNQKTTALGWRDYGDWIKRAEAGEVLDAASAGNDLADESHDDTPPKHAGKVLLHNRQIDELVDQMVSAIEYDEASGAPWIAMLRYLQLAATGELYQDTPHPIEYDAESLIRQFMRGIMAHTLDGDDLAAFGERALDRLAGEGKRRSASTETRAYAREASDTIERRSERQEATATDDARERVEFDPREAVEELLGQINGSLTPEKYADALYSLIVYARDRQGALEGAYLSDGLDALLAHTTRGRQLEKELQGVITGDGTDDEGSARDGSQVIS